MQRSDLSISENIPLLDDLDVAECGMVTNHINNIHPTESLIVRLEKCLHLLNTHKTSYDNKDIRIHNSTLVFYGAIIMIGMLTPVIIEGIMIFIIRSLPIATFVPEEIYDELYCHTYSHCIYPQCEINYPISSFNNPWPYAVPKDWHNNSTLFACYELYNESIRGAEASRDFVIALLSLAHGIVTVPFALILIVYSIATLPKLKISRSDSTTLMMLPEKMQQEINYLATQTKTNITDCSNINQLIEAFRPALEEKQRARQRRAFLSGSLRKNENSPLYRFFNGQTVNDKFVRGDGDMATTERIFKYAGLLK